MKRNIWLISISVLAAFVACQQEPITLVDQTQHLDLGYYWTGQFQADADIELETEIEVTTGGPVDVLLMNAAGYDQFEDMFKYDTLVEGAGLLDSLPPYDEIVCYWLVADDDKSVIVFSSDAPANVTLYHQNWTEITSYTGVTSASFDYTATQAETLFLDIYNPASNAVVNYSVLVQKPQSTSFTYYVAGSALNVTSKSYSFTTPETGQYYIVVNNGGQIEGGATPEGAVDFHIITTGQ